jgi:aminoglycoside phosphotransferase (APT) family kinase protein
MGVSIVTALNSSDPIPISIPSITTAWLTVALGIPLTTSSILSVLPGTATKVFLEVAYANASHAATHPTRLCLKGGFDEALRALGLNSAYRREAEFFAHIAPRLAERGVRVPRALFAGTNSVSGQGIVVLEDLVVGGYGFGECAEAWAPKTVAEGLAQLAGLHALTWGAKQEEYSWLGGSVVQEVGRSLFTEEYWWQQFETEDCPAGVPEWMKDRERMLAAFETLWENESEKLRCVIHGDCHVGNTFVGKGGEVGFLDYQAPSLGSAMHDVAYFLSGALSVENRRKYERDLVEGYLEALEKAGGPKLGVDEVWKDYRMHTLHGFVWVLTCPRMQTKARVDAMTERHVAAIEDHVSVELLEGLRGITVP